MLLNRMKLLKCFLLIQCLFLNVNVFAQSKWSLQTCVEYALKNNLSIQQQALSADLSQINVADNSLSMLPSLNGSAGGNINWGRSVDPYSYTFTTQQIKSANLSLNANVNIFNGFQLQNVLKQSKLDYIAGQNDLKKIQNDVSLNVAAAYLQVLFAKEQLKVLDNRVKESTEQKNRTQSMVDAGAMPLGNLLDAKAQLANEVSNKTVAENQYKNTLLTLLQLMELPYDSTFTVEGPTVDLPALENLLLPAQSLYEKALAHLPEINSAKYKVLSAEKGVDIAKAGYMPRLSGYGSLSTGYSSTAKTVDGTPVFVGMFPNGDVTATGDMVLSPVYNLSFINTPINDQFDNNLTKSIGISLNIPIFNGLNNKFAVSRAKINFKSAELMELQTKNNLFKSIQQANLDAHAAQQKYNANSQTVAASQEAFNYAKKRYEAGVSNSLEFLNATNNLTRSQIDLLQSKFDFVFKVKILDFYAGNALTF